MTKQKKVQVEHICYQCKGHEIEAVRQAEYERVAEIYYRCFPHKLRPRPNTTRPFSTPEPLATPEVHPGTGWDLLGGFHNNFPKHEGHGMMRSHTCYQCKGHQSLAICQDEYIRYVVKYYPCIYEHHFNKTRVFVTPEPLATPEVHPETGWDLLGGFHHNCPKHEGQGMIGSPKLRSEKLEGRYENDCRVEEPSYQTRNNVQEDFEPQDAGFDEGGNNEKANVYEGIGTFVPFKPVNPHSFRVPPDPPLLDDLPS